MSGDRPNWLRRLFSRGFGKAPLPTPLELIDGGFAFVTAEGKIPVRWAEVKEVFAFKRDIFSVDLICIGLRTSDEGHYFEIDEQMPGYDAVRAALPQAFAGFDDDWWCKVAYPPFKTCFCSMWGEQKMAAIWELRPNHLCKKE